MKFTATQKMQIARSCAVNYLSDWSDRVDKDSIIDALFDDDDFCNEVTRAADEAEIENIVEAYTDNVIEENGIAAFEYRDW